MRVLATIVVIAAILSFGALCFLPERTVYISGAVSYAPKYRGNNSKPQVALMFNCYEGAEIVNGILDKLRDNGAIATFFVGGCWADDNTETLKRIVAEGHEIANHGYFHLDHKKISAQKNESEISNCHKIVKALTGVDMTLFAPPSGSYGETTLKTCAALGYQTVLWTLDTIDWRDCDKDLIVKRATEKFSYGALILMHPKAHTLDALDDILRYYKEKGVACVSVSECIKDG